MPRSHGLPIPMIDKSAKTYCPTAEAAVGLRVARLMTHMRTPYYLIDERGLLRNLKIIRRVP